MSNEEERNIICHKCGHRFENIEEETLILCPDCKDITNIRENNINI